MRLHRVVVAAVFLTGCFELPNEYEIEDLRILEVRTDPPEIRIFDDDAPIRGPAEAILQSGFDTQDVRFSVLAAHPDLDADYSYTWIRCKNAPQNPGEPTGGFRRIPCDGAQKVRLGTDSATIALSPVQLILDDITAMNADPVQAIASLASDPRDLFSGLLARFNVNAAVQNAAIEVDTRNLDATKRLVIYDPAVVGLVLELARSGALGSIPMVQGVEIPSLCTNVSDSQLATLYNFLEDRTPNQAPTFRGVEVTFPLTRTSTSFMRPITPIVMAPGDAIGLEGLAFASDLEQYRVIDDNCELVELDETLAWSWFVTDGQISTHITSRSRDVMARSSARTTFTAPFVESERRVRIYSVLRDGRGGSDSLHIDVIVRP